MNRAWCKNIARTGAAAATLITASGCRLADAVADGAFTALSDTVTAGLMSALENASAIVFR